MKKATILALAFVLALSVVPGMAATGHTGTISLVHYNPHAAGRGVGVRTSPEGPGTGWFCLYTNHVLYTEIDALLRDAYLFSRSWSLVWDRTDGHGQIFTLVQCQ